MSQKLQYYNRIWKTKYLWKLIDFEAWMEKLYQPLPMKFMKEKERQKCSWLKKGAQNSLNDTRINVQEMVQVHNAKIKQKESSLTKQYKT